MMLFPCVCPCQDVLAGSNTVAEEVLSLSRTVRTFGTEGTERNRYASWLE